MPNELAHGQVIKSINVIVLRDDGDGGEEPRELFNLSFSERDESLYLRPVAPTGIYLAGDDLMRAGESALTFDFRKDRFSTQDVPAKLSIHATGQVHVKLDQPRAPIAAGPVMMPPLQEMRDHHIATFHIESIQLLAPVDRATTAEGENVDLAFPFRHFDKGRVIVYANAVEPVFAHSGKAVRLDRGGKDLYVSFLHQPDDAQIDEPRGFTVLTGWDPLTTHDIETEQQLLFVRCE